MTQNELQNSARGSYGPLPPAELGLPPEMNIADICRGMLTGWPQLTAAMRTLAEAPQFRQAFGHSYASEQELAIGSPQQLLAALAVNPALLTNPTPPTDVYAWTVWLTLRTYEAARTVSVTLAQLPGLFGAAETSPAEVGTMVQTVLAGPLGLAETAGNIAALTTNLGQHLQLMEGNLEEAQAAYRQRGAAISSPMLASGAKGLFNLVTAHADAQTATQEVPDQLSDFKTAAAQVSVLAVIANMSLAIQASSTAWQATKRQFQGAANEGLDKLGSLAYLQGPLQLAAAAQEWTGFMGLMRDYSQRTVLLR